MSGCEPPAPTLQLRMLKRRPGLALYGRTLAPYGRTLSPLGKSSASSASLPMAARCPPTPTGAPMSRTLALWPNRLASSRRRRGHGCFVEAAGSTEPAGKP